jgi:hypothetical protein
MNRPQMTVELAALRTRTYDLNGNLALGAFLLANHLTSIDFV